MVLLTLMRHGEPQREHAGDPRDPGLSDVGLRQVADAARVLAGYDAVYASPLLRARQTAAVVAAPMGLPVVVEEDLAEFDRGTAYQHWEDGADVWHRYLAGDLTPWGTTLEAFATRVRGAVERIAGAHAHGRVLAVCHGGVVNTWACQVLGVPERVRVLGPEYASLSRFRRGPTGWRLEMLNAVAPGFGGGTLDS